MTAIILLGGILAIAGCNDTPAEPDSTPKQATPTPKAAALVWKAPATWTIERTAESGQYRGKYQIPKVADDKHDAELLVSHLGRGSDAKPDKDLADFQQLFESYDAEKDVQRETFKVGAIEVQLLEIAGTYKFPMGPAMGKQKRHTAHVIKKGWRGIAAGVSTPKRGHWFFRMVGPSDTMQAARSPFRAMLEGLE